MNAEAALTPQIMDAMLARVAEICMEGVEAARQQIHAAEDGAALERAVRSLNSIARNLRQTFAMKHRCDREVQQRLAAARDAERQAAQDEAARRAQASRTLRARAKDRFHDFVWDEYEHEDAEEIMTSIDLVLAELSMEPDFIDTPLDDLVRKLAQRHDLTLPEADDGGDDEDEADEVDAFDAPDPQAPEPQAAGQPAAPSTQDPAVEPDPEPAPPPEWPPFYLPPPEPPRSAW